MAVALSNRPRLTVAQKGRLQVRAYYDFLCRLPDHIHLFYLENSSILHVDPEFTTEACGKETITALMNKLDIQSVVIDAVHSVESLNGNLMVVVRGSAELGFHMIPNIRKFYQFFDFAPKTPSLPDSQDYDIDSHILLFTDKDRHYPLTSTLSPSTATSTQNSLLPAAYNSSSASTSSNPQLIPQPQASEENVSPPPTELVPPPPPVPVPPAAEEKYEEESIPNPAASARTVHEFLAIRRQIPKSPLLPPPKRGRGGWGRG